DLADSHPEPPGAGAKRRARGARGPILRQAKDDRKWNQPKDSDGQVSHRIAGREEQQKPSKKRAQGASEVVRGRKPPEFLSASADEEVSHEGRCHRREDRGGEAVEEAQPEQRAW